MPVVILESDYARVAGWSTHLPVAEVSLKSIYPATAGVYRGQAVIDSGSDVCWVPKGFPRKYGWPDYAVDPRPINTLGGRAQVRQFVLIIRLSSVEWKLPVCEAPGKGFDCPILGQDVLEDLIVLLQGPVKRLTISK